MQYDLKNDSDKYQKENPENGKNDNAQGGSGRAGFLSGILTGVLLSLLVASCLFTAKQIYTTHHLKETSEVTSAEMAEPKEIVSDLTMSKLRAIEDAISNYYYKEDVDVQSMIDGMYEGVVASLGDPYSTYYTQKDVERLMEETEGIYYGIGAYVGMDVQTGLAQISGVIDDTPAEEAGLRDGDIIYKVDDEDVQGLELSEVVSRIKGLEGTTVHLTLYREGENNYLEFDIERRKIESPTVKHEMFENNIGYLQITEFDDITLDQFTEAMAVLRGQGMRGLVLDLRSNPGGNLSTVTEIARQMLPKGLIVYTEDREGNRTEYSCDGSKVFDLPLVVLVNGYSASASEILAGAIKDYGLGELVGTTTFGKGIVQRVLSLSDGTALKLTVSSYFTPKGNNIHGIGIEPDEVCELDSDRYYKDGYDNQLERAKEIVQEKIAAETP
ncbi:MAG: S41 family peptidase [Clostridiales bacterium]|nr:S41 family peptidase [Clostridiales bacterium]